ncbi:MAG: hypothetical protein HQL50_09140, partial [Magnetococcales bacterium]|nr:hypothetical protein [Magnetococcales bacterium]
EMEHRKDAVGMEVMSFNCPFELIDDMRGLPLPGEFELTTVMSKGGKGKGTLYVQSMSKLPPIPKPNSSSSKAQKTA